MRKTIRKRAEAEPPNESKTILVVDDNPDIVLTIRNSLERYGYRVQCAYGGSDALAFLRQHKPDLVLLDLIMPGIDGFKVLERIKRKLHGAAIPVCIVTGTAGYSDRLRAQQLGADDCITKPFTRVELVDRVNTLLKKTSESSGVLKGGKLQKVTS